VYNRRIMSKKVATPTESTTQTTQPSQIGPNTRLSLKLKWAEIEPVYQATTQQLAKQIKLKGFRKGKVPAKLAMANLGESKIIEATLDKMLPKAYQDLITSAKKTPLSQPNIVPVKIDPQSDWELDVEIAEAPEVKLGDYKKVVKNALKEAEKEEASSKKSVDSKQKSEVSKKNSSKADDAKHAAHTHDHGDHADHDHDHHHDDARELKLRKVFAVLVNNIKPAIPSLLVKEETQKELQDLAQSLQQLSISVEDYLARRQITVEQLSGELAGTALARLQLEFILMQIGQEEKLDPTDAEIEEQIKKITNLELQKEYRKNDSYRRYVAGILTRQKVIDYLLEIK
jgi:FKBP-type peptidyl-prolyl cis-trans isomerase (trigger factor)